MRLSVDGQLDARRDFAAKGLHRILVFLLSDYLLVLTGAMLVFAGKRIRTTTAAGDDTMRAIGAEPVRIPDVDAIIPALSAGQIDGVLLPYRTTAASGTGHYLRIGIDNVGFGVAVPAYAMPRKRWRILPRHVRRVRDKAAEETSATICVAVDAFFKAGTDAARSSGISIHDLATDKGAGLQRRFEVLRETAAERLDASGVEGTEAMDAFNAAIQ